jgi:oxygen-dependent protoporphyrinogen oxidase
MRVIVVGGGIAGLTAAYDLASRGVDVTLFEAEDELGGKIRTTPFAGLPAVDCGADAFLARVPWAVQLARELGLGDELISPASGNAYLWTHGALRGIPMPNVLGVPLDMDTLRASGVVSDAAVDVCARDLTRTVDTGMPDGDESLGSLVRRRLGDEVLEQLVDPLLGGIYAGDADHLSLEAGAPQIAAAARADASLIRALAAQREATLGANPGAPVFFAPPDGMSRVVRELENILQDKVVRGVAVERVERDGRGGYAVNGRRADAVVLATPAFASASLLRDLAPDAAQQLDRVEYAGVALVTMAFARDAIGVPLDASGFLVPKPEDRVLTACSWSSTKWAHLDRGAHAIVRASTGHYGNEAALGLDDDALVAAMLAELREAMALRDEPVEVRISRWPRSFPQYTPGHAGRVDALVETLHREAPGVVLTGAAYRGIGIPALVRAAREAVGGFAPR